MRARTEADGDLRTTDVGGLAIAWDDRVLEPRPWTAIQSRWAAELAAEAAPGAALLEVCCGAGHIGLLAAHLSGRSLVAVDLDPVACAFTRRNADAAGLADRVDVRCGLVPDVVSVQEGFPVVVLDPPWVPTGDVGRFPADPVLAIDGGADGLTVPRELVGACAPHVTAGGSLLLQLGDPAQAAAVLCGLDPETWADGGLRQGERGVVQRLVRATRRVPTDGAASPRHGSEV